MGFWKRCGRNLGRESDYVLSREAGMYKGPEAGVPRTARKQKAGAK